ncbi:hypothetical protein Salat_1445500 [Sesamum alatum]|uniref:Uncharacterized protein n=1 Tax=Sesamum alatum TaxID=300844 RepID=A0AAE2CLR8_9LAMI|nr:hypothetical protein Salat_1445500 [Sesamum alatum]
MGGSPKISTKEIPATTKYGCSNTNSPHRLKSTKEGERILDCSLFDYPHHNHGKNIYSEKDEIIGGEEPFPATWENGGGGTEGKKGEDTRRHLGKGNEGLGFLEEEKTLLRDSGADWVGIGPPAVRRRHLPVKTTHTAPSALNTASPPVAHPAEARNLPPFRGTVAVRNRYSGRHLGRSAASIRYRG